MSEEDNSARSMLSKQLTEKAEKELKEKPEWRERDIQGLRDMVLENKDLKCPTDNAFLLRFLRARKFNYERAYELLLSHFRQRSENPDVFKNFKPSSVKHILEAGVTGILPDRDQEGRRVIVFRPGLWKPDGSMGPFTDVFKTNILSLMKVIKEDETQVNGVIMLGDMAGMTMTHARHVIPNARRISTMLQDAFPARFKGIHYVNEPTVVGYIFGFIKPFLKEKMKKRIHFHCQDWKSLHDFITADVLPSDYGGNQPQYSNKAWMETLLASEDEYKDEETYYLKEVNIAPVFTENKQDAMECVTGTYKKLSID